MYIIDRYALRLFLKVALVCFISFTGLYIVIDAFGNLEEFLSYGSERGSLMFVLAEYYGARVLEFFDRTGSLLALISSMFVVTWMQRSNELTAVMAAGVAKSRMVMPLVFAAMGVSLIGVVNRELFIPAVRDKLSHNIQDPDGTVGQQLNPRHDHRTKIFIGGNATFAAEQRIANPHFGLFDASQGFGRKLTAQDAFYHESTAGRPAGYWLKKVVQPPDLKQRPSYHEDGRPVILSPLDTPWLAEDECFVVSDVSFELLEGGSRWGKYASSAELIAGLHNPSLDFPADVRVTLHSRFVQPFLDISLLFLGLPLVVARESRNVFVAAGLCLLVVIGYFLVVIACHAAGANQFISSPLSAWAPLMIFAPIAFAVARSMKH